MLFLKKILGIIIFSSGFLSFSVSCAKVESAKKSLEVSLNTEFLSAGILKSKEVLFETWRDSFANTVDPALSERIFHTKAISSLAKNIEEIDLIEIFSRLNRMALPSWFLNNSAIFEILEQNINVFFTATHDFLFLFRHLKDNYYKDRKLAIYLKVTMCSLMEDLEEATTLWSSLFEICNNNIELDELELLAANYFEALKPPKKGKKWLNTQNFVDYVFANKAAEIHAKTLEEYKKISSCLDGMTKVGWLADNQWFVDKYYENRSLKELDKNACDAVVSDKLMQAKIESEKLVEKAAKNLEKINKDLIKTKQTFVTTKEDLAVGSYRKIIKRQKKSTILP